MIPHLEAYLRVQSSQHYAVKYKGIAICTAILARCLDGGYVNFGVFALYGDPALDVAMDIVFKLLLSVPVEEVSVRFLTVSKHFGVL